MKDKRIMTACPQEEQLADMLKDLQRLNEGVSPESAGPPPGEMPGPHPE